MLAIIIPYYKRTFFEATLQSLAAQTCQDFKVYIGDDASVEDPSMLLEKYKGKFDVVYHRFATNLGGISLTQQWERCIALSKDEPWLMILGDDDVLGHNVVEAFYENFEEIEVIGCNVVRFATQVIDEEGDAISGIYEHPKLEKAADFLFRKTRSSLSEYVFKKEKVFEIGFRNLPLGWHSDILGVLEFSNFDVVFTIHIAIIYVRFSEFSISGSSRDKAMKDISKFKFYYILISKYEGIFGPDEQNILYGKLKNSLLNKLTFLHYLIFIKYTIRKMYYKDVLLVHFQILNIINKKIFH